MRISIFIISCVYLVDGLKFRAFNRYEANDDKTCETDDTVVSNGETSNLAKCLGLCNAHSSCNSVFVNLDLKLCYGCSRMYNDPTGLPSSPGTKHYGKPASHGEPCSSDDECTLGPNMGCYGYICDCTLNYHFDNTTNECKEGCPNGYGSTFKAYLFTKLVLNTEKTHLFRTLSWKCKNYCASKAWCLGFNHAPLIGACYFKNKESYKYPDNLRFGLVTTHFTRECA